MKVYDPQEIVNILKVRGISVVFDEIVEEGEVQSVVQAQRIVEMDNIVHCHQLQAFMVKVSCVVWLCSVAYVDETIR